jgi:WD40 repeat protein/DNA-binding SARP family transcriptional activator
VASLEIFTLGGVRLLQDGKSVEGLSNRKAEALLIYLASARRSQPREVLADLLWDERTQSQSLANLRVVLTILRQSVGDSITISRGTVAINPSSQVWLDTAQLDEGLRELHQQGRLNTSTASKAALALDLYRGDFLEGFSVADCRRFEDWQVRERERLHHLAVDGYSELVAYDIELRDYQLGLVHAARLLELDPLMESAHRQMMLLLAKCGQRVAALNQYETCRSLLLSELGVGPTEETRKLKEQIRTGKLETIEEIGQIPSGTVTFLFVEVDSSSELLERLREQFAALLDEYHHLVHSIIKKWHGHEIALQGDSFLTAFGRATDALGCAIEFQQRLAEQNWPQGVNVLVRMGLHTGEPVVSHTGYIGVDVHRAALISGAGYGGQVLLSRTTRDLVYLSLPNECRLRNLGTHAFKDSEYPQEIFQLDIPGLPSEFPPLTNLDRLEKEEEPPAHGQSPYMGMKNFEEKDVEWFFGRKLLTERLVGAVRSHDFLAVIGASGSGKSSVVRAGLIPAIKARYPSQWQVKIMTPSSHPLEALAICLTRESESITATTTLIDDLLNDSRSLYLYCQKHLTNTTGTRLLLVIDQFEELFTLCRSLIEQGAFVNNLIYAEGMPGSSITIVLALRADFYAHLAQYPGLTQLVSADQIYIGQMTLVELREAIEGPAQHGGWEFSPGLIDLILSDLGAGVDMQPEPGALPLLSHALLETWKRRRGSLLSLKAYMEAGGVRGAIAKTAEGVFYRDLSPTEQGIAKGIFLRLTELGEGTQDTRRRISIKELIPPGPAMYAEQIQAVLVKLADARLITTGEGTVEVAHEALIREWATLREWLASDREGLRLHRHLTEAAQEWELLEMDPGALYRGTRLNQALEWVIANPRALNAQEQAYLEASREVAEREQAEREAARLRELETARKLAETESGRADAERQRAEEQGRSAKRLRQRAWWLGGVLMIALILAAIAGVFWRQSDIKEREATSRFLNSAAVNNLQLNPQLSAHLALQALQVYPEDTFEAENTLHTVLPELRLVSITPITITRPMFVNPEATLFIARQGELFIHTVPQGIEVLDWENSTRSIVAAGRHCAAPFPSRDGHWLAALCTQAGEQIDPESAAYDAQVWDAETGQLLFTLPDVPDLFPLPFDYPDMGIIPPSADQPTRVWASTWDMMVHIWEVSSGRELFVDQQHSATSDNSWVNGISSPDGKRLLTFDDSGLVVLWNLETYQEIIQFNDPSGGSQWVDFSPDGTHLAIDGNDESIRIYDLTSLPSQPRLENRINHSGIKFIGLRYSPDGMHLAAGSEDGYTRLWDAETGELQLVLSGQAFKSWPLSFSQDGMRLYTASGGNIMEWDLSPSQEILTLPGRIGSFPFSPDGKQLVLIGADNTVSIVDSQTGEVLVPPWQAHSDWIDEAAWSPDGSRLVTSSGYFNYFRNDNAARIWDPATGQLLKDLPIDWGYHLVAWSPDGNQLAASNFYSGTTFIWDTYSWNLLGTRQSPGSDFALAYNPDGGKITTSSSSAFAVWDAITGSEVFTYTTDRTPLALAFSPDGEHLAAGLTSGDILLFRLTEAGGKKEQLGFAGGDSIVWSLAFSPDGTLLAAGDATGKIWVWEVESRHRRLELQTFSDAISRLAFSPDGNRLVASGVSGTTYFYVLPLEELIEITQARILLPMTEAECREYLNTATCPQ